MRYHVDSEVGQLRHGDPAPPRPGAEAPDPDQQARPALRRRAVGQAGQAGARRLRGVAAGAGRAGPVLRAAAARDARAAQGQGLRAGPGFDERVYGPVAVEPVRTLVAGLDGRDLTECLIGGLTKREALERMPDPRSVTFHAMDDDDFLLPPLPNHLFTRDTSCWIHDGVAINSMRKAARIAGVGALRGDLPLAPRVRRRRLPHLVRGHGGRPGDDGGRRRPRHRPGRGAGRDERADHPAGGRAAGAAAVRRRCGVQDRGAVHAEGTGVHAPRHGDDDGRPRDVHRSTPGSGCSRRTRSSRAAPRAS